MVFDIFFAVIFGAVIVLVGCRIAYWLRPDSDWFCRELGWHNGDNGDQFFDGCSTHGRCTRCDKKVMLDSQGNWFREEADNDDE